jgi:glucokinase
MGTALGIALASLMNIFNFPLYLLSGGVLAGWDQFAPAMMREVEQRSFTYRHTKTPSGGRQQVTRIEKATLGNLAGLFGAAYLPLQARSNR